MKKYLLTMGIAMLSLAASAQYMVTTTVNMPEEGESWEMKNVTDELGIGYMYEDVVIGMVKSGDDYDVFGRYSLTENAYVLGTMATDSTHSLSIGVGYSLPLWKELYIEPYYIKEIDSDIKGIFRIGLTYKI
tara:strand:- start:7007 stop:7402 length:396 start_codon:yes stop_codon:yes gene_type:complete